MVSLPTVGQVILIGELKDDNGNICCETLEEMFARGRDNLSPEELAALVYARKYLFEHGDLEFDLHLIAQLAVVEGHATAHTVDGQVFFVFNDEFKWGDYGLDEPFFGRMILTETDDRMSLFIKRPSVNGVAVPFGLFHPSLFQTLFESGWDGTIFEFYHFRSTYIPESLAERVGEMRAIAEHYALASNSQALGDSILRYLGYFESLESGAPQATFRNRDLNSVADRWSGLNGATRHTFAREIEAHADMLMDNDIRANLARWGMENLRDRSTESYFDAVAIADMAADDTGLDTTLMELFWSFGRWR